MIITPELEALLRSTFHSDLPSFPDTVDGPGSIFDINNPDDLRHLAEEIRRITTLDLDDDAVNTPSPDCNVTP